MSILYALYQQLKLFLALISGPTRYHFNLSSYRYIMEMKLMQCHVLHSGCLFIVDRDTELVTERLRRVIVKDEEKRRMCNDAIDGMDFGLDKTYAKVTLLIILFTRRQLCFN